MIDALEALRMPDAEVEIVLHMRVNESSPELEVTGYPWKIDVAAMTARLWAVDAYCEGGA